MRLTKLKIIHVPDVPYPSGMKSRGRPPERSEQQIISDDRAYETWEKKYKAILGVIHNPISPLTGGFPPFDFVWVGKSLYKREAERQKFFYKANRKDDLPDIICKCGSTSFTLTYGDYSVIAICVYCGTKEEVYSG
jgi:hypothetical protein